MNTTDYLSTGFAHIDDDLHFLITCFQEVLVELGQPDLAACLPWVGAANGRQDVFPERAGQAFAVAFQLLNMVEESAAAHTRRKREANEGLTAERGLWGHSLQQLRESGLQAEQIAETMRHVRVEPVLTAHPTEAKRLAVLEAHRTLFQLLEKRGDPMRTLAEQDALREEVKATLERIWRTGEVLLEKPDIADERRNVLHYLRHVFPQVLPHIDLRLRQAWKTVGFDSDLISESAHRPRLHFGTWVGGDRDGHPLVTAEVTQDTLRELRLHALLLVRGQLSTLAERLSLSSYVQSPSPEFTDGLAQRAQELGERGQCIMERSREEPWRQFTEMLLAKLPLQLEADQSAAILQQPGLYRYSRELHADLHILRKALHVVGATRIAEAEVEPVLRAVEIFGFHLASLDIRQNSRFHDLALAQIMQAAGMDGEAFPEWPEGQRLRFINEELQSPRPFLHSDEAEFLTGDQDSRLGPEARAVLSSYRVLARHIREYGPNGLGALIVSMTRNLSDLLVVYLLAREAGLAVNTPHGLICQLKVVPLFETLNDLRRGPEIVRAFLEHPLTRRSLTAHSRDGRLPIQQVMVGYSDSNKDAGIFASQWGLHGAQAEIAQSGRECGVRIRFFHGRGGTVSRGAGPTHRFLEALPHGSLSGDMRLTEQGETFAQKYANLSTATHNLELLLAGVTATTLQHQHLPDEPHGLQPVAEKLASWSCEVYQQFLQTEGFMEFFRGATPIDALECSRIGSRPARRTGQATLADLRAIPWVFSWNQSRFYLPGWYGVGSALERLCREDAASFARVTENLNSWPFLQYLLTNVETMLASADLQLMHEYSQLVDDPQLRARFMNLIETEFKRTEKMLDHLFGRTSQTRRPRMWKTLQLRAEALRRLHMQQIALLRQWREYSKSGDHDAAEAMLPQLLLSINAIASGLRTTG